MHISHTDWQAIRVVHLPGGCRAVNELDPTVRFEPAAPNGQTATFTTRAYGAIFGDLETLNLEIVGSDFYAHSLGLQGITPPDWRSYHRYPETVWPSEEEVQRWAQIGHAAFSKRDGRLWDIASRISHQLSVCSWRLRQISESYREQLDAKIKGGNFRVGTRFVDGFTWLAYLSIQAYLVDACVLRDYMAEYYALVLCESSDLPDNTRITSMAGLKRKVLGKVAGSDPLRATLRDATDEGGWLHELGAYRDLVVHSAPLAKAQGNMYAVASEMPLGRYRALPAVCLPIPADPVGIVKARATGKHFEDFERQFELFIQAARGTAASTDGMMYAHSVLGQLSRLARQLGERSPLPPEIPRFDETNIIGPIKITPI